MVFVKVFALVLVAAINLQEIYGHGMMMDPVNRGSAWRKGFKTPPNYNDNEQFCGGLSAKQQHGGKCGECGDNWAMSRPRPNENGGTFGTGVIVKEYQQGTVFTAQVHLAANHLGTFKFDLCVLQNSKQMETDECFERHPLQLADGSGYKYRVAGKIKDFNIDLRLPQGVTCKHCVIRWDYLAGNHWGICPDGRGGMGCGPHETFRSCADVSIV